MTVAWKGLQSVDKTEIHSVQQMADTMVEQRVFQMVVWKVVLKVVLKVVPTVDCSVAGKAPTLVALMADLMAG